ncbi:HAD-IIA family hydrolase [Streptomyces sp. MUM 203J]|uniref:HAD-IIA family hydrolase n=1 Tax=Streptomyces sp. MUM 203J TaxID=2791990 RepID=UPI001F03ED59|nr:HAD-IIA family hydrolase [Streptomyces sp. MUM 203J]MCH0538726.1 HAD-IIA family hydrolase [Streptomyces sp. MUM 203J]
MTDCVLDLDGTLYYESTPIDGAVEAVARLRADGHRVVFATNDATLTRAQRAHVLSSMGFPATEDDVITSGFAAAHTVASHIDAPRTAMVLGPEAIVAELSAACPALELVEPEPGARADAVVVGLDQQLSYDRLRAAHTAIRHGARFIATNADSAYPASDTETAPGAGALVAALERSTGARASVVGKPDPFMLVLAARRLGVEPASLLVVGDSTSDLVAAARCGARSVRVLTGMAEAADTPPGRTSVLKSIAELPGALPAVADAWAGAMSPAAGERPDGRPMSGENA